MIAAVISLNRQLEGARFAQFWAEVDQLRDLVNPVVGFYDAVRDFIVYLIESTFQKVSTATLAQSVRLEGASLNSLVRTATWSTTNVHLCHCFAHRLAYLRRLSRKSAATAGRSGRTAQLHSPARVRRKWCLRG